MAILRSPVGVMSPKMAARLRYRNVRGLLESAARTFGDRLTLEELEWLDEIDELAHEFGHSGHGGRPEPVVDEIVMVPMTTADAAVALGLSERHVRRLYESGGVVGRKAGGRLVLESASVWQVAARRGRKVAA